MYEAREIQHKLFKLNLKSSKKQRIKKITFPKVFFLVSEEEAAQGWGRKTQSWSRRRLRNWSGIHTVSTNTESTYEKNCIKVKIWMFPCNFITCSHRKGNQAVVSVKEFKFYFLLNFSSSLYNCFQSTVWSKPNQLGDQTIKGTLLPYALFQVNREVSFCMLWFIFLSILFTLWFIQPFSCQVLIKISE